MNEVVIAGIGQTSVGEQWDISLRELAYYALEAARLDAGGLTPQALYVSNMLAPALSHQSHLATLVADFAGLQGIEASTIEAAGASGGMALRMGYIAVASGTVDVAMVLGVEKMTDQTVSNVTAAAATTMDADYEAEHGLTLTSQAALLMKRYLHEFDVPEFAFSGFPIIAHANGATNKNAMFQRAIKLASYQRAGMVSDPMNMFDVAPNADGSAAVILTRPELLPKKFVHPLIQINGSSAVTDTLALHDRPDPIVFNAARLSVERACSQAGIIPSDVDLFELYDAFSIYGALALEAAGLSEKGKGWEWASNGDLSLEGKLPISTFGGLKARGNPGGATGVYQAVEATLQLRNQAGENQVKDAKTAMIQAFGGPSSTSVTHILSKLG
ncbi:MAG: thiolase domain-containing protein [Chloroflexi bacterium]|jgi:acetyl-CoA C-acetyltransferase|nr:thiolase domain-containing protein [Chloroflexota bacterium]MBT3670516.1 thiolase domain-containing protein [Chloroflexota bacterium]MBT4304457.1 thiolase domain-containing protein [Chloroflexota bacterium]MBT4532584.1 thiolase domain-containing protein [Chloroflexota bacterium]MBT4682406.1 thiolase domain-containing protein [Chloroflexota bacterium]